MGGNGDGSPRTQFTDGVYELIRWHDDPDNGLSDETKDYAARALEADLLGALALVRKRLAARGITSSGV